MIGRGENTGETNGDGTNEASALKKGLWNHLANQS